MGRESCNRLADSARERAARQQHRNRLTLARVTRIADDGASGTIKGDAVAALERLLRRQRAQPHGPALQGAGSFPNPPRGKPKEPLAQRVSLKPPHSDPLVGRLIRAL